MSNLLYDELSKKVNRLVTKFRELSPALYNEFRLRSDLEAQELLTAALESIDNELPQELNKLRLMSDSELQKVFNEELRSRLDSIFTRLEQIEDKIKQLKVLREREQKMRRRGIWSGIFAIVALSILTHFSVAAGLFIGIILAFILTGSLIKKLKDEQTENRLTNEIRESSMPFFRDNRGILAPKCI